MYSNDDNSWVALQPFKEPRTPDEMSEAKHVILKQTQVATFKKKKLSALKPGKPIAK